MRFIFLLLLAASTVFPAEAQKKTGYGYINRIMYRIPDSLTGSTEAIAGYITRNFSSDRDRATAAYFWIARNIRYNFDSIITNSIYETPESVSSRILKSRTGVCLNYVTLFNEITRKTGIRSYAVQGYTKQNGRVDYLPHMWCAAWLDSAWYLFDPTWGSGYYYRGKYLNEVNSFYCMAKPQLLIRTHTPFDPMWQLLYYPATHREFARKAWKPDTTKPYFNYNDSLSAWENASELEKAAGSARRIEDAGITNEFIAAKVRVYKGEIEYLSNRIAVERYDSAVKIYNLGIHKLNQFINLRNERDEDTVKMAETLDTSFIYLDNAVSLLNGISSRQQDIILSVMQLRNAILGSMREVKEQMRFVRTILD
ncbi:MAG TPA: transglutaminase domain-containing protein [Bacteroidales bacterium]|nr:transglutaminase domain-containing protein [Bacteroidales bacterium]